MKSSLYVVFLLFVLMPLITSAQKSQKAKAKPSAMSNAKAASSASLLNYYKHYVCSTPKGFRAVLDLHRIDSIFFGNYYDNSLDAYVYLTGKLSKKTELKLVYTDGRACTTAKKELKNLSLIGTFLSPDTVELLVSTAGSERLKFITDYSDALPFELCFHQNTSRSKNKTNEAKYSFSISGLFPARSIIPITDSISIDLKRKYYPKKYKQLAETKNKFLESIEKSELASWKKQNLAFTSGKTKNAINIERAERAEVFFNSSDLISIAYHSYYDNGSAHPSSTEVYRNYDIKGKKVLHVGAVFEKDAQPKLLTLIAQVFLKEYNQLHTTNHSRISDLGLPDELPLPENIAFNKKGVFFVYNEAELGLSYQSKVVVFIEFKDLKPFLEPTCALLRLN